MSLAHRGLWAPDPRVNEEKFELKQKKATVLTHLLVIFELDKEPAGLNHGVGCWPGACSAPRGSDTGQAGWEVRCRCRMPEDGDLNAVGLLHQSSIPLSACASFRPALYLTLSLSLALLSACASLSLVVLAGCQPSSSNKLQLCSSAMAHAREPEDMQSLSFQTLVPHSMHPTICFLSYMVLWQLDNPLRKYKAKSLWMIHLVTLLPYSATVVFFHSVLISFFLSQPYHA